MAADVERDRFDRAQRARSRERELADELRAVRTVRQQLEEADEPAFMGASSFALLGALVGFLVCFLLAELREVRRHQEP